MEFLQLPPGLCREQKWLFPLALFKKHSLLHLLRGSGGKWHKERDPKTVTGTHLPVLTIPRIQACSTRQNGYSLIEFHLGQMQGSPDARC
jgi:hypothetical protein